MYPILIVLIKEPYKRSFFEARTTPHWTWAANNNRAIVVAPATSCWARRDRS